MDLHNHTAIVTGASGNIGQAIAIRLAEAGADVGITSFSDKEGCEVTAEKVADAGSDASVVLGDLSDPNEIEEIVRKIRNDLGPIDILVNNAAVRPKKDFLSVEEEELDHVLGVNMKGTFLLTQKVIPDMLNRGFGSIVNIIGGMVYIGSPQKVHSYGSKMGVAGFVRQLATEYGEKNIRVNGISPGPIDTEGSVSLSNLKKEAKATLLGRMGSVEEIANVCCFLVSDQSSYITGQIIHVNGGMFPTPNIYQS